MVVWGTGRPQREFLHVDDLADAALFLMRHYNSSEIINEGTGVDLTIAALARLVASVTRFQGEVPFDPSKPDGTPRKLLDISRLTRLGWTARTPLEEGLKQTYHWFVTSKAASEIAVKP